MLFTNILLKKKFVRKDFIAIEFQLLTVESLLKALTFIV